MYCLLPEGRIGKLRVLDLLQEVPISANGLHELGDASLVVWKLVGPEKCLHFVSTLQRNEATARIADGRVQKGRRGLAELRLDELEVLQNKSEK